MKVIVIGAGIVGASIAYNLSIRPGVDVTVLDAAEAGSGASEHSFAWTNAFGKKPRHYHDLNRRSMDMWHRFVTQLGVPEALASGGNLILENTEERAALLRSQVAEMQAWGYPSRLIDAEEIAALEPALAQHHFTAACYSLQEGQVDLAQVVRACLERAQANGAMVLEHAGSASLHVEAGIVRRVNYGSEAMECDVVVVAAGTGTPSVLAPAGLTIPQPVSPGIVMRTDPRPRLLQSVSILNLPAIDERRREIHVRQLPDGSLQLGQGTQESLDKDDSQAHAEEILARAIHYLPVLQGATAIARPVGYRPMPEDGLPVVGPAPSTPNAYVAMMHSGVTLAPLIGELVAMEVGDGVDVDWLAPYRPDRFA